MSDKRRKELIWSIIIKSSIIVFAVVGLVFAFLLTELRVVKFELLYFTIQSNIWICLTMIVFLALEIKSLATKKEVLVPQWLQTIKYVFTVAITLTGIIYNFLLFPASFLGDEPANPLALDSIFVHIFVPVLSIVDFIVFDYRLKTNKWSGFYGLIAPLYYLVFALVGAEIGAEYKDGARFPYFFLNHEELSWFGFNDAPGVFYWLVLVLGVVLGISYLLIWIKNVRVKRKTKKEEKEKQG